MRRGVGARGPIDLQRARSGESLFYTFGRSTQEYMLQAVPEEAGLHQTHLKSYVEHWFMERRRSSPSISCQLARDTHSSPPVQWEQQMNILDSSVPMIHRAYRQSYGDLAIPDIVCEPLRIMLLPPLTTGFVPQATPCR